MNLTAAQIANYVGLQRPAIVKRSQREGWHSVTQQVQGGETRLFPLNQLPIDVQAAVLARSAPVVENTQSPARIDAARQRFSCANVAQKEAAATKAAILQKVLQLETKLSRAAAVSHASITYDVQKARIYEWFRRVDGVPVELFAEFLIDSRTNSGAPASDMSQEAWDWLLADYLRLSKRPLANCYRDVLKLAGEKGWTVPSYRTVMRRVEALDPHVVTLARDGEDALKRRYPAQRRDRSCFFASEALCADGHKFDVFVRTRTGRVVRPIMVAFQDLFSNKILSHRIGETESADITRLAFLDACIKYSRPLDVYLDNGRGFSALMLSGGASHRFRFKQQDGEVVGLFKFCDVEPHFTLPYSGQSKPIERAWKDLCNDIAKHAVCAGAYTGPNPLAKPEDYGTKAIAWDVFAQHVAARIAEHNARTGRRTQIAKGQSFDAVFDESFSRIARRVLTAAQRELWLLQPEPVSVLKHEDTVSAYGNRYHAPELARYAGKKIVLRLDPDQLHVGAVAYSTDGQFIAQLNCVSDTGFKDRAAASEHAAARREFVRNTKRAAKALQRVQLSDLQQVGAVADVEAPNAVNVVAGAFQPRAITKTAEQRALIDALDAAQTQHIDELAQRRRSA